MNDEIKEILDNISDNIEYYYVGTNGCLYQDLTKEQLLLIKDYITNLQQEKDKFKSRCEKADKFIMSKHNWYGDEEEDNEEYLFELEDFEELLNIINGGDK